MSQPSAEQSPAQGAPDQRGHIDHQIDVTRQLITSFESEIQQLEETIESRDGTIRQLRGEITELKKTIEENIISIARLTENKTILEAELNTKTAEIKRLTDRLQIVLSKDGASDGKIEQLTEANKMLERQRIMQVQNIQKLEDKTEFQQKYIDQVNDKLSKAEKTIEQMSTKLEELKTKCESLEEDNAKKTEKTLLTKTELSKTVDEKTLYYHRMNELMSYEEKCGKREGELHHLNTNVLPEKERTISALIITVNEQQALIDSSVRETIPRAEHLDILNTNVEQTINTLRETYREEYKAQIESLETKNDVLEKQLADTERDVESMEDKKEALLKAEMEYKRIAKQNVELTNKIEDQKRVINGLREKLSHLEGLGRSFSESLSIQ